MKRRLIFTVLILLAAVFMLSCSSPFKRIELTIPAEKYIYTGNEIRPEVTVTDGDTELVEGKDYTVSYSKNKDVGTAEVTVSGKGDYDIKEVKEFKIVKSLKLKKNQYSKYIEGKVTEKQFAGILNIIMDRYHEYQTIDEKLISIDGEAASLFPLVKKLTSYRENDKEQANNSCSIEEINQKLSSFTDFRFTPDAIYQPAYSKNEELYTDGTNLHIHPKGQATKITITSAKLYAEEMAVVFKYTGAYDKHLNQSSNEYSEYYETSHKMSEKYVAVLKKQSNDKYKLVKINLKDSNGMRTVAENEFEKLIKGKLKWNELDRVLSGIMYAGAKWDGTTRTMNEEDISKVGVLKKANTNAFVAHAIMGALSDGPAVNISYANRLLSVFTSFRYEKNHEYSDGESISAKTNQKEIEAIGIAVDGVHGWTEIEGARCSTKEMVILFTYCYDVYPKEQHYHYKAILKKDKTGKFKLVRIEKTIPCK